MSQQALLLPGGVLPKDLAYASLLEALGDDVDARAKDLEVYAEAEPSPSYELETELDGILREAEGAGFERFHLAGYSAGGAIALTFAASHPERLLSLSLLEPAWIGNEGLSDSEQETWAELDRMSQLPTSEMMRQFVQLQLAPGVEPPPPPPGPPPPWMERRPPGLVALTGAFRRHDLDPAALRAFEPPVYYALGALSSPGYYGRMAERLGDLFNDYTLDIYEGRHHFDPPHRVEPDRLAARLRELWDRAS